MVYTAEPLKVWEECKTLTRNYYGAMFTAHAEGKKLAWMGASLPPELIRLFDVVPVAGEPYAATCNFRPDLTTQFMQAVDKAGFARDLCCYTRTFLGSILEKTGPFGELPEPDFILSIKWDCTTHIQWWSNAHRLTGKPVFIIEAPFAEEIKERHLNYFVIQLKRLIAYLEEVTGKKLDEDGLVRNVILGQQAADLWDEILEITQAVPNPLNFKSLLTLMVPAILMRGTPQAVDYYRRLRDELAERVKNGISGIPKEKKRIIWINLPLWYDLNQLKILDEAGIAVVTSPYTSMWGNLFTRCRPRGSQADEEYYSFRTPANADEALREMAKAWLGRTAFSSLESQRNLLRWMMDKFKIDGAIAHDNRGCKVIPLGQMDNITWLQQTYQVPIMVFEANHGDPSNFSEGQIKTRLQAFQEILMRN
ncbi:MAG: 2-hydroxyacyl-CoA dehydratase family protein [Candidatus Binatia bacterium]|jgi:benzoyl-CoA reductase/2-hydroxyglutaryl-CoA dehydratase subunit BcrC/BadD/HgdB|nr:2-hydroxyacyl-CoA dehydratase family protein [Candidatus Binatia bacterium]